MCLDSTLELFNRIAIAKTGLQKTNEELYVLTDLIQKTLAAGGVSGAAAVSSTVQLSQALSTGEAAASAEEIRSVVENAPLLARFIQRGIGTNQNLIAYIKEHGLTGKQIADAILSQQDEIIKSFGEMETTLSQVSVVAKNNLLRYLGNELYPVTVAISSVLKGWAVYLGHAADEAEELKNHLDGGGSITDGGFVAQGGTKGAAVDYAKEQRERDEAERERFNSRLGRKQNSKGGGDNVAKLTPEEISAIKKSRLERAKALGFDEEVARAEQEKKLILLEQWRADERSRNIQNKEDELEIERIYNEKKKEINDKYNQDIINSNLKEARAGLSITSEVLNNFTQAASVFANHSKRSFENYKALATAQAIVATSLAIVKALAEVPFPANVALATSLGILGFAQVANIQSQQYQGRQFGGYVQAGVPYRVGESRDELFTSSSGRQTFIPGENGYINNKSGGGLKVMINNHGVSSNVRQDESGVLRIDNIQEIVDVVKDNISKEIDNGESPLMDRIQQNI